jgi:hypothetical protein
MRNPLKREGNGDTSVAFQFRGDFQPRSEVQLHRDGVRSRGQLRKDS